MQQRQFTSGSRQAPDPYDQFLEEHQYYRKHTARDASCLFRVISEQMYDTQLHHLAIREKCVTYMRKHRKFFQHLVDRDFDEYLDDMSKPKTYGTLLELQAVGYLFERNVILFEPFDLGNYFNEHRSYFKEVFRVFYTPERHFDSVFTSEYIQEAAICQSICYEILYKDLFKLPDVAFAVEQMLHGPNFENMEYTTKTNEEGYATRLYLNDGREFELDLPHHTNCILENYKLCHFHYINFPRFSDDLQRELKGAHHEDNEKNTLLIQRTAESFLPNKYMSCVRQLLQESITPFPYKVAKALDPNMYRNIEFDSWNEMRKEMKLQNWYNGDSNFKLIRYHTKRVRKIFQVGAKCHVKLRKSEQDLYTCHIQEIAVDKGQCIVFIEQLGEKRLVPYENLTPLPPDQFKPWTVPYRFQRQMQKFSSVRFTRQYNYRFKFNATTEHHHHQFHHQFCGSGMDNESCSNSDYINEDDPKRHHHHHHHGHQCAAAAAASYYKLKQYTHLENFRTQTVEFCTMPLTVEHNGSTTGEDATKFNSSQQQRNGGAGGDSNENSRPTSRTTNNNTVAAGTQSALSEGTGSVKAGEATTACFNGNEDQIVGAPTMAFAMQHGDGIYELDHYNAAGTPAVYVSELQSFYPMYSYPPAGVLPEEYYGYCGYDAAMAPPTTFMSTAVNSINGYYYVCGNGPAPPGSYMSSSAANQYIATPQHLAMPGAPPHQNVPVYAQAPPPFTTVSGGTSGNCPAIQITGPLPVNSQNSAQQHTPSPRLNRAAGNQHLSTNTPLSGRINYDARKSYKANGVDLPTDTATLRFFYNLGLDYYQQKQHTKPNNESNEQSKVTAGDATPNDEVENMTADLQNIRLDENANQVTTTANSAKSDANNNTVVPEANDKQTNSVANNKNSNNTGAASGNSSTISGGNKTNHHRRYYPSRSFGGNKDRQMHQHQQQQSSRNHMNSNSNLHVPSYSSHHHQPQQQQQQNYQNQSSRNNSTGNNNVNHKSVVGGVNNGGGYQTSTTPNSSRNVPTQHGPSSLQPPQHPQQLQPPPHVSMAEHSVQTSPMCGFDDPYIINDSHSCNTPTSNNSNVNPVISYGAYGGGNEQLNDGMCGGPFGVPLAAATAGSVFVPMPMGSASGPPHPYGLYATHAPPPGYHTASAGVHPNFINGPLHLAPPPVANSASGSDTTETNAAADMMNTNNGVINVGSGGQCPSYPPPPMPYYYASGGVPPPGNGNGQVTSNAGSVHLITQMAPPTPTNHAMTPSFSTPHPPMGPQQGYFCLPPPPPHAQQMPPPLPPQQMQHLSPMTSNGNNNCARPDMSTSNE